METLKREFDIDMKNIYLEAKKKGYNATRFFQIVSEQGGYAAAKLLIQKPDTEGFLKLWDMKILSLSVEALVTNPKYRSLFLEKEIKICKDRLISYEYKFPK